MFEITADQIGKLNDTDARTLVGLLAEQEAIRHGSDASTITFGGDQRAEDGGIDVRASLPKSTNPEGYIARRQTGYQVKAEKFGAAQIKSEMRPNNSLRQSIKSLGKIGGAYIIVSSKDNCSDTMLSSRRNAMAAAIIDSPESTRLHLDFYDQNRLARWVNQHPGLVPWVRAHIGEPLVGWRAFGDWSSSPEESSAEYVVDDHIRLVGVQLKDTNGLDALAGIERVRDILKKPSGAVRLVGLSGVGKTRYAQALFDHRIGEGALEPSQAVYADLSDGPTPLPLELLERLISLERRCVLIIDNCGVELHRKLVARLKHTKSGVRLLTIEYDISDDEPENTDVFKLEPSSSDVLEQILGRRYVQLSASDVRTIASFSEGNARVAIALAETAKSGESLANLSDSELFKRLFVQKKDESPGLLIAAKAMSLVYSFDGETLEGDEAELPILANLAGQSIDEFYGYVSELKRRKLVQSRGRWRALLPHALAHKLAGEFLQDRPLGTTVEKLLKSGGERLLLSFSRRLGFLHESAEASEIVSCFLSDGGWLSQIEALAPSALTFFDNVAPVAPEQTLKNLAAASGRLGGLDALPSATKEAAARLLRGLAYDADTFEKAALMLSETISPRENRNTSTAHNDFISLFHLYLSGTHATADQRAALLLGLTRNRDEKSEMLVLDGVEAMLRTGHFSSSSNFEFGARKRDFGWQPSSYEDVRDWYAAALSLLKELLDNGLVSEARLKSLFAQNFLSLARRGLVNEIIPIAQHIAATLSWPEGWATVRATAKEAKAKGLDEIADRYFELARMLVPTDMAHRITAYVMPERWAALDLADIDEEDESKYEKANAKIEETCKQIGEELAQSDDDLRSHIEALMNAQSARVSSVGYGLSRAHSCPANAWNIIMDALSERSVDQGYHLGVAVGFLRGLEDRNPSLCDALLDGVFEDERLRKFFLALQYSVVPSEEGWERIVASLSHADMPVSGHTGLVYWPAKEALNAERLEQLADLLLKRDGGFAIALHVVHLYLWRGNKEKPPPTDEERSIARKLLAQTRFEGRDQTTDYEIQSVCASALRPGRDDPIAELVCEHLSEAVDDGRTYGWDYPRLIEYMAKNFPLAVLNILIEHAGEEKPPYWRNGIFESYRDEPSCPISMMDSEVVIGWANGRPSRRFDLLASSIRPWKQNEQEEKAAYNWSPIALEILLAAPNPKNVLLRFTERFRPTSWSGSRASLMEARLPLFQALKAWEHQGVVAAAVEAEARFRSEIVQEREWEERQHKERAERFDW